MLSSYCKGRQALKDLENVGKVEHKEKLRGFVIESIVDFAFEKRLKYTRKQIESFSKQIQQLFPSEKPSYYYVPPPKSILMGNLELKKFNPKGKLFDAYNNSMKDDIYQPKRSRAIDDEEVQHQQPMSE